MDAQVVLMSSALSEEFVRLRSTLLSMDPVPRSVAVLGASGQEGASLVAARLALSFASVKSMGKVLLAEGNVRQPSLAQVLGCPAHPGLLNWDAASPLPVLEISRPQALSVMVAGESGNPQSLLALDDRLQKAAEKARESFDMVIWDAPAMTRWSDAVALAGACDGVIVVIEMDETRVDALRFLRDTLARHRIPILGSVLNRTGRYWPRRRAAPAAAAR